MTDDTEIGDDTHATDDTDKHDATDQWVEARTAFQRVYDTVLGTTDHVSASVVAERAHCSETATRNALSQLVEMGVAECRDGRPATYRRNESYLTWKRVERLAAETDVETLRSKLATLTETDREFQDRFDAPEPDAVTQSTLPIDDHEAAEERWDALSEWRTVRQDVRVLRRAVDRARRSPDEAPA